jgi:hypothetical protein
MVWLNCIKTARIACLFRIFDLWLENYTKLPFPSGTRPTSKAVLYFCLDFIKVEQ